MVDKRGDPEVGDFGDQFWPLLKERLAEFVVFLFYFEDLLACLLVQPEEEKNKITNQIKNNWTVFVDWVCIKYLTCYSFQQLSDLHRPMVIKQHTIAGFCRFSSQPQTTAFDLTSYFLFLYEMQRTNHPFNFPAGEKISTPTRTKCNVPN